ncbi:hypothetical protein OG762_52370 (plasmid) [Streptomyces sp. NBC_01136]|uniref:hypothetical protein n=1 Tax=Streptomyces sp. NBC_01136 TaxID=2903754 RepID=UPI0037DC3CF5|nr:hypothetical protein OG762_52370 [Streptomyces sp. NBC_01136]
MTDRLSELVAASERDALRDQIEEAILAYLNLLDDPGDVDSDDLAENIINHLERGKS